MMLIIRASFLNSYGKNIAKPRYDQKKDQCAKYCHAPLNIRIHLVFWWISPKRHFATLTLKFLLNPITKETMTNLQNTVKRRGIIVVRKCEIRAERHSGQKYGQFAKLCHRPFIHGFPLVYLCVSCKQHFGVLPVKFLLNQVTTHKMTSLKKVVTRLTTIVLCYSYSVYHEKDTLELLP